MNILIKEILSPKRYDHNNILILVLKKYNISKQDILSIELLKRAIDSRKKQNIQFVYHVRIVMNETASLSWMDKRCQVEDEIPPFVIPKKEGEVPPIVVGFGPAGMFSALLLAEAGLKPIILERGAEMIERIQSVERFWQEGALDTRSNVQFGEGGAGTFSDGKLTTNVKDPRIRFIFQTLVRFGAPTEILYDSYPHIGTDLLREIVIKIREHIISLGGIFYFKHQFINVQKENQQLKIIVQTLDKIKEFHTIHLILALGHSARDTFQLLKEKEFEMEPKPFSMGVRIEHRQDSITKMQYGCCRKEFGPASYKLAVHLKDRSLYTFCMCPGGIVVPSNAEEKTIVTNGMSYAARDGQNANSALLVNVEVSDYFDGDILSGMYYQERYEKLAYQLTNSYRAPANLLKEFLTGTVAKEPRSVIPSYSLGVEFTDLAKCLPDYVIQTIREGMKKMNQKIPGFLDPDAVLTGVETRSSSPIRIKRNDHFVSNWSGVYPCGEGAGYAGGITSSALDGLKVALEIISQYQ